MLRRRNHKVRSVNDGTATGTGVWDVSSALRVTARFADWLSTPDATRLTREQVWSAGSLPERGPDGNIIDPADLAKQSNAELAAGIRSQAPIWVDPAMVDLLAAAAAEFEPTDFQPWHLPHPEHGLVILAKPMPADWIGLPDRTTGTATDYHHEICAITWEAPLVDGWVVRAWSRRTSDLYRFANAGLIRYADLCAVPVVEPVREGSAPGQGHATRALAALTALMRTSSNVKETRELGSKAARKVAARFKLDDPVVRRLYLNRPESGAAELDALRAARTGAPRGHWVRGHWKRQWYPATEEHHWHWIDGYPRGDFETGSVPGARVQVARPPRGAGE